jgi:orotidine-5'-phosphate decarboxylase
MTYLELLKSSFKKFGSIACMGLDPVIDEIPLNRGTVRERIFGFYEAILNRILQKNVFPSAVKPNYAFYAQHGLEGIESLLDIISLFGSNGFPVILDVKRGDIGSTADAYSRECFLFFRADAVTLSPFLGIDSISPFIKNFPDKGYYVLNRTSNPSAGEIQDVAVGGDPLFMLISRKILEWHSPGMGAVVGATHPSQLKQVSELFISSGKEIPLLIPGIGTQGGSVKDVCRVLALYPDISIHRINSSSSINYAYKRYEGMNFDDAAVRALAELNEEIDAHLKH